MDMQHLSSLLLVGTVSLVAAISPGPDFLIVVRNSLVYSRKAGFWTSFGVACGLLFHLAYTLVGIGVLIAESELCYNLIKYAGVAYLFYLGITSLVASFKSRSSESIDYTKSEQPLKSFAAFKQGFLTNVLNPKCALFFVSLFSQFITPATPVLLRFEYVFVNWAVTLGWFLFLTYLITAKLFAAKVHQARKSIDGVMGGVLVLLGLKILFV
jgi:RhtB (resistance to homoserine/threonine) family protein